MSAGLRIYRLATHLAAPAAGVLLWARLNRAKEDPNRVDERRGLAGIARPKGPLIWLHGASVGEAVSLLELVDRLQGRGFAVLVTTGTVTSARLLAQRLPAGAVHQFVPLDVPRYVGAFLDHWRPDLAAFVESELWPNLIVETARRGVPLALVNARMSERSRDRWMRAKKVIAELLGRFSLVLAQSQGDALRLAELGAGDVRLLGNLKYDSPPLPVDAAELSRLSGAMSGRQIWIAASTHRGEEIVAARAHRKIAQTFPDLLTLIAPRHPDRAEEIVAALAAEGSACVRRSQGGTPGNGDSIWLCDTIGELGLFYRLAGVVFVGKTLTGRGGQNPIEPAKLACAILHGPATTNFADVFARLDASGGAALVRDEAELTAALHRLFDDPARARSAARAAAADVAKESGAADRVAEALTTLAAAHEDKER